MLYLGFYDNDGYPKYQSIESVFDNTYLFKDYNEHERHVLKYYNHKVNMAPYLFFLGVGTYEVYRRTVEYPSGESFLLELVLIHCCKFSLLLGEFGSYLFANRQDGC